METPTDGCRNFAARTSDAPVIIQANWAGYSEETLGYQLLFKRIAGVVVAQLHGNIHIGDILEEIVALDQRHVMDTQYLSTLRSIERQ